MEFSGNHNELSNSIKKLCGPVAIDHCLVELMTTGGATFFFVYMKWSQWWNDYDPVDSFARAWFFVLFFRLWVLSVQFIFRFESKASGLSIANVIAAIFWAVLIAKHEDIFFVERIKTVWLFPYLLACMHKVPQAELKVQISKQELLPSRQ